MGMLACYMEADNTLIERLKMESSEDIFEAIEECEEEGDAEVYDMDKLWDGLHFILTGVSASTPVAGNPLSEAVLGAAMFSADESDDFISYIYAERVSEILTAMNDFDIDKAIADFSPQVLAENDIYPDIWAEDEKDELGEELSEAFYDLREFYAAVERENKGVIVSIY